MGQRTGGRGYFLNIAAGFLAVLTGVAALAWNPLYGPVLWTFGWAIALWTALGCTIIHGRFQARTSTDLNDPPA